METSMWPDRRLIDLLGIEHPIVQAPMAGAMDWELVAAVAEGGGLGSLPCAMLGPGQLREQMSKLRSRTQRPINVNFFCHEPPRLDNAREAAWRDRLAAYYRELGLDPNMSVKAANRAPFDEAMSDVIVEMKPRVVSFHFGLPDDRLLRRLKEVGCLILGCATTAAEARWLQERGADLIVAQGVEAGGHRGMFLSDEVGAQVGTFALVPQVVCSVQKRKSRHPIASACAEQRITTRRSPIS
jgi:nitronate monooxygenase